MNNISKLLMIALISAPTVMVASAQTPLKLTHEGLVEPRQRAQVSNQISGVIAKVHFQPGQRVKRGDLLYTMDSAGFQIDIDAAKAALAEARAKFALAKDGAGRQAPVVMQTAGEEAKASREAAQGSSRAAFEAEVAKAAVARAEAALAAAELALARTRIVAPISGIARSIVAPGTFVKAKSGKALGEIVQTDPVYVAYQVPYQGRQKAMTAARTTSIKDLFAKTRLSLRLPSGALYAHAGKPKFESPELDARTGMLTTWSEFPNPDGILIPGLQVEVISVLSTGPVTEGDKAPLKRPPADEPSSSAPTPPAQSGQKPVAR